jgi:branched-chain amino acid transport system substrate-binding protein
VRLVIGPFESGAVAAAAPAYEDAGAVAVTTGATYPKVERSLRMPTRRPA